MSQYLKPNPQKLRQVIRHVVVLMLENRSFDNLLGWLYADAPPYDRPSNGQAFEGLTHNLWNPLDNVDPDGVHFVEKIPVRRNGAPRYLHGRRVPNPVRFTQPDPDPGEGFRDTNHQLFQHYTVASRYPPVPTNMGFVQNYQNAMLYGAYAFGDEPGDPRDVMSCYTPQQTPVLSGLARGFAVCDHYHSSVPSQTLPNRDFIHAATSTGYVNNGPIAPCDAPTIFNQIQDAIDAGRKDLRWGIFGDNPLGARKDAKGAFGSGHFSLTRLIMTRLHDKRFGVRVPCVLVSPYIPEGLVARPAGFTPYDHTSVIKTVQTCFELKGSLTERDKAAPDFSGVLTLDAPRGDGIPSVEPLEWDPAATKVSLNALHRVMATVLGELTGNPAGEPADFPEFIRSSYAQLFARPSG